METSGVRSPAPRQLRRGSGPPRGQAPAPAPAAYVDEMRDIVPLLTMRRIGSFSSLFGVTSRHANAFECDPDPECIAANDPLDLAGAVRYTTQKAYHKATKSMPPRRQTSPCLQD